MVRAPEANQTAAERGEAELRILNSKTTWSEFQRPVRALLSEAKPSYVYSISKPHGQNSYSPIRLLSCEAKPSYIYTILKPHYLPESVPSSCVRSGYFLVVYIGQRFGSIFYVLNKLYSCIRLIKFNLKCRYLILGAELKRYRGH